MVFGRKSQRPTMETDQISSRFQAVFDLSPMFACLPVPYVGLEPFAGGRSIRPVPQFLAPSRFQEGLGLFDLSLDSASLCWPLVTLFPTSVMGLSDLSPNYGLLTCPLIVVSCPLIVVSPNCGLLVTMGR